jgi:hypothetical protein
VEAGGEGFLVAPEGVDEAAVAFGGAFGGCWSEELGVEFAGFRGLQAGESAGFSFGEERLGEGGGGAAGGELEDVDLEGAGVIADAEEVVEFEIAGGLGRLCVAVDAAGVAGGGGEGSGFEETSGPEPFIEAKVLGFGGRVGHDMILVGSEGEKDQHCEWCAYDAPGVCKWESPGGGGKERSIGEPGGAVGVSAAVPGVWTGVWVERD